MNPTQILIALSESANSDFGKRDFAVQAYPQKVFSAVFGSSGAIMMDGLESYFRNSDGESAHFVVAAYQEIGLSKRAEILARACNTLSEKSIPESAELRCQLLAALPSDRRAKLKELSKEFMHFPEAIDPVLFQYVKKHPEAFGGVPEAGD